MPAVEHGAPSDGYSLAKIHRCRRSLSACESARCQWHDRVTPVSGVVSGERELPNLRRFTGGCELSRAQSHARVRNGEFVLVPGPGQCERPAARLGHVDERWAGSPRNLSIDSKPGSIKCRVDLEWSSPSPGDPKYLVTTASQRGCVKRVAEDNADNLTAPAADVYDGLIRRGEASPCPLWEGTCLFGSHTRQRDIDRRRRDGRRFSRGRCSAGGHSEKSQHDRCNHSDPHETRLRPLRILPGRESCKIVGVSRHRRILSSIVAKSQQACQPT